jgi:hypothetical protein
MDHCNQKLSIRKSHQRRQPKRTTNMAMAIERDNQIQEKESRHFALKNGL